LFSSDLPSIVAQLLNVQLPAWTSLVRASILVLTAFLVWRSGRFPYLHAFIFSIAALLAGDWLQWRIENSIPWFRAVPHAYGMFVRVFLTLIPAGLMVLTFIPSDLTQRDLFLVPGNLRAPSTFPLFCARWSVLGPMLLVLISAGLIVQLWAVSHPSGHFRAGVILAGLPAAIVFAVVNSSCEEFRFRCVLLAQGARSVGMAQAIAATSILFGLAHFNGHPSGISGVLMSTFFAWVVAKSMVDTGGWGWAWLMHFVQDVIIFLVVLMTGV
jgi:membrane protease YdiL (CAAX protease family)